VAYTATTGRIVLKDEAGKAKAALFFIAYTRKGERQNRGLRAPPAASSPSTAAPAPPRSGCTWGCWARAACWPATPQQPLPPPYQLVDNEFSLLDLADIVFIDPVSTGYSRPAPGEEAKQFHGLEPDIESVGEFIRLYVTRYKRWSSPKFLAGESYGTTRAVGLGRLSAEQARHVSQRAAAHLQRAQLPDAGVRESATSCPTCSFCPTYTATAWYHQRLDAELQADLHNAVQ
jgi:carboxypeptidase C (cathepsin A)